MLRPATLEAYSSNKRKGGHVQKNNPLEKNLLICGDNLNALDDLIKKEIKADLIYLDPPFFSNKHYEVIWGDEAEVRSFRDRWEGGVNVYIEWMRERIIKMYDVLNDNGSFYLHCDWHASHYLKILLDNIFGPANFQNEIIWYYGPKATQNESHFQRKHDTIFFYTKSNKYLFNTQLQEYSEGSLKERVTRYQYKDEGGRYRLTTRRDSEGKKYRAKVYLREGVAMTDVWDINVINATSHERIGYPTQKPEALLERIIKASSNKGDSVLDPFCGCGTAMATAQKLRRKWIGIDISPTAIKLIEKRVEKAGTIKNKDYETVGMPTTLKELRKLEPFEFQNWVINEMKARQSKKLTSDFGLDGYYEKTIFTERAGIQVKQSENVGRNVVDNFETALSRGKFNKGFIVAFSFTRGAHEEAARVKSEGIEIRLIEVEDLLLGKVKI
jgi:DNA modification methylase